jgi:NAD kinase
MTEHLPRVVIVTRATEYEQLLAEHGTRDQAAFFLHTRGRDIAEIEDRHHRFVEARDRVVAAIPRQLRRGMADRSDLDRFLFEPDDIVVAVGQDGLVPNVAKYLDGQPVIGVNPAPDLFEGVLVRCSARETEELLHLAVRKTAVVQQRTMVEAQLDDGPGIVALNELFIGHRSHQSARYRLSVGGTEMQQISSGLIVATGTGATGWARSISLERHSAQTLPDPDERRLTFFVREPFPASGSHTEVTEGSIASGESVTVWSEMEVGGTVFGDGIESDGLPFDWGRKVTIGLSERHLRLVMPK